MSGRENKPRVPRMPGQRPRASLVAAAAAQAPAQAGSAAPAPAPAAPAAAPVAPDASVDSMLATVDTLLSTGGGSGGQESMDVDPTPAAAPPAIPSSTAPPPAAAAPAAASTTADVKPTIRPTPAAAAAGPSSAPMVPSRSNSGPLSRGATPASGGEAPSMPGKMKFKPKMPIRRAVQQPEPEVKVEQPSARGGRGRGRGRGAARGARGGGRGGAALTTIAAGPFGGTRPAGAIRRVVPPPPPRNYMAEVTSTEVYSDNEDGTRTGVIDIEAVSGLGESAPTSVYRERDLDGGKAKARAADKAKIKEQKQRRKAARAAREAYLSQGAGVAPGVTVKDEPVSPVHPAMPLPQVRHGDSMIAADAVQDRDEEGRRMRAETSMTSLSETPDVDAANAVNLSESEEEEYEEDMEGDFVFVPGLDNPEDKLFTFQFPTAFPKFVSRAPIEVEDEKTDVPAAAAAGGAAGEKKEEKKEDVKPSPAALRKKGKAALPPPEGRIGTLCVMKSGKVKLVLGEGDAGIVMNVTPGVPNTFLQQLVHLDQKRHATTVLGEVHKGYVVMPDIERLLEDLWLNGGETPGDRERAARIEERRIKMERGLVKMEPSSP